MNTPQSSEATNAPPALEGFADISAPYAQPTGRDRDLLAVVAALCIAAPRNGQALDVRAKEGLALAREVLKVVGDEPTVTPAMLERGTIGSSMLTRQLGEANTEIDRLRGALTERNAEAQAAQERAVALETELRQTKEQLEAAKGATSSSTSGPAPKPPKAKVEGAKEA